MQGLVSVAVGFLVGWGLSIGEFNGTEGGEGVESLFSASDSFEGARLFLDSEPGIGIAAEVATGVMLLSLI